TKTFTQEDVNNIATKEARKAQEKVFKELGIEDFENAKEGFQKFQEWQESQKTEAQKQAEQLETLEKEKGTLSDEKDRKSTRLNSSHVSISYAVFCLKKKKNEDNVLIGSDRMIILIIKNHDIHIPYKFTL